MTPCKNCGTSGDHYCPADVEKGEPATLPERLTADDHASPWLGSHLLAVRLSTPHPENTGGTCGRVFVGVLPRGATIEADGSLTVGDEPAALVLAEELALRYNTHRPLLEVLRAVEGIDFNECTSDGDEINAIVAAAIAKAEPPQPRDESRAKKLQVGDALIQERRAGKEESDSD